MSVRSATGYQLERAELLSTDSDGNPVPPKPRGFEGVQCKESRGYVNATLLTPREEEEDRLLRQGSASSRLASLTPEERRCLELADARGSELDKLLTPDQLRKLCIEKTTIQVTEIVLRAEEDAYVAAGWHLKGRPTKHTSDMVKNYPASLSYEDIAWVTGLSASQVHSRIVTGNRKMRGSR